MVNNVFKVSELQWTLTGYTPFEWQMGHCKEIGVGSKCDINTIPAAVPGSVQNSLLNQGIIPDWNTGLNARQAEWVENRHWLYETILPDDWIQANKRYRLRFKGLDHKGCIYFNGKRVYEFENCHLEHTVEITPCIKSGENKLQVIFECPPRWLGQFYLSSRIRQWKPRFYYTWDWTSRIVQIGIWDDILLEEIVPGFTELYIHTDYNVNKDKGKLILEGGFSGIDTVSYLHIEISDDNQVLYSKKISSEKFEKDGHSVSDLSISPWWPNNHGEQNLYNLDISLLNSEDSIVEFRHYKIGFKNIEWSNCKGSKPEADPWICKINGKPIFLQGINWTPIKPDFADLAIDDYRKRLELYKSMGINIIRVWGGSTLEKSCFYNLCDKLGLLVWQEFPLCSSGIENYPPDDSPMVGQYLEIVKSYVLRRHHHISLLLWSGGNELTTTSGQPLDIDHPMLKSAHEFISRKDPAHRFVPTSPSGPNFTADYENYGKCIHWDVHGPWIVKGSLDSQWERYWRDDDSLFRSEVGAPGPSNSSLIKKYSGDCDVYPDENNPLWRRNGWWLELDQYKAENGQLPSTLEDYVEWGRKRQAEILTRVVKSCKDRFPECGGIILWMGHDCFPCTANTSLVDFEGNPKPAAVEISKIFNKTV